MRISKTEKIAAGAVVALTGAVVTGGVKLLKRHHRYVMRKATAFFEAQEKEEAALEKDANVLEKIQDDAEKSND